MRFWRLSKRVALPSCFETSGNSPSETLSGQIIRHLSNPSFSRRIHGASRWVHDSVPAMLEKWTTCSVRRVPQSCSGCGATL
jgi:hypothetical protein